LRVDDEIILFDEKRSGGGSRDPAEQGDYVKDQGGRFLAEPDGLYRREFGRSGFGFFSSCKGCDSGLGTPISVKRMNPGLTGLERTFLQPTESTVHQKSLPRLITDQGQLERVP
jgi:hypothetical protein